MCFFFFSFLVLRAEKRKRKIPHGLPLKEQSITFQDFVNPPMDASFFQGAPHVLLQRSSWKCPHRPFFILIFFMSFPFCLRGASKYCWLTFFFSECECTAFFQTWNSDRIRFRLGSKLDEIFVTTKNKERGDNILKKHNFFYGVWGNGDASLLYCFVFTNASIDGTGIFEQPLPLVVQFSTY